MPAGAATCVVIDPAEAYRGKQGLNYVAGISAQSAGSTGLCMHLVTIPPGARATPHYHARHETAIYVLSGEAGMWYGEGLREHLIARPGQLLYIPAGVPHLVVNRSEAEMMVAVVARTDPAQNTSVVVFDLPPHLDGLFAVPVATAM